MSTTNTTWRTPTVILVVGCIILTLSMGVRHTARLFLQPMTADHGWSRETFSFAIAIQNLVCGLASPFAGALADRHGAGRTVLGAAVLYVVGLVLMSQAVDDPYKQLDISAKTDRDTYKPGETVHLQMHVKPRVGQLQPTELAVAVVDEAVLDLLQDPNKHYDIYHGLYQLADLDVANYSLINRLVGRQKFEKKGANPGGDGGAAFSMRSLFKYVSYWNPSIVVDANGYANTHFTLPDNLTRWRIIVLGITKTDQMGTGTTDFTVNRLTELRPTIPNHVLADAQFIAGFSVMNRFAIPMGFAAIQGTVPAIAWLMLLANIFWAVAYDTEYAMVDRPDDLKIGIRSSAITFRRFDVAGIMLCYALAFALLAWVGVLAERGAAYFGGLVVALAFAGYHYTLIRARERAPCFKAFLHNNWVGAVILAGPVVDYALGR